MDTRPPHKGDQPLEAPAIGCRQQRPASDPPRWPPAGARLTPTGFVATQHLIRLVINRCNVYCITLTVLDRAGPRHLWAAKEARRRALYTMHKVDAE